MFTRVAAAMCCLVVLALGCGPAMAGKRVALVIGNSQYKDPRLVLSNPRNDAADVGDALKALDFEVIKAADLDIDGFDDALHQFSASAKDAEIALFFYAGHAVQWDGKNYLIPVNAVIDSQDHLARRAVVMDSVQQALAGAQGVQVIILDACRDNPFAAALKVASRSMGAETRGIERISVGSGDSIVLYSTRANEVALDGVGTRNSPFSSVLIEQLQQPGEHELGGMLRKVAAQVKSNTGGKQSPELTMSISGDYNLDLANDRTEWDNVKNSLDPSLLRAFAKRFPDSPFRAQAENRASFYEKQAELRRHEDDVAHQKDADRLLQEEAARQEEKRKEKERKLKDICSLSGQLLDMAVTGRDLGRLQRLSTENKCPSLQASIDDALKSVLDMNKAASCSRVEEELGRDSDTGDRAGLTRLQADAANCPGLSERVQQALHTLDVNEQRQREAEAQQRVCDEDQARLDGLRASTRAGRIDDIAKLSISSGCDKVRTDATAAATELRRQEAAAAHAAQQQTACAAENGRLDTLAGQGPRSAIEALGRTHACETLDVTAALARFDDMMERRQQQAKAQCDAVDVARLRDSGDSNGLNQAAARCPSRQDDVRAALAALDAKRKLAEACQREGSELQGYVGSRQQAAVDALQKRAACPTLDFGTAAQQIAKASCDITVKALGRVAATDEATLRAYAGNASACPDARNQASARVDALIASRQSEDSACDARAEDAIAHDDVAQLEKLPATPICVRRHDDLVAKLDALRAADRARIAQAACDSGVQAVTHVDMGDEAALRGFASNAQNCPDIRNLANRRLSDLAASRTAEDARCDAAIGTAEQAEDRDELGRLTGDPICIRKGPALAAAQQRLVLAERSRILDAQAKLADLGCFDGKPSGALDEPTRKALAWYDRSRNLDRPVPTTISVAALADLKAQDGIVCVVPPVPVAPPAPVVPVAPVAPGPSADTIVPGPLPPAAQGPVATAEPETTAPALGQGKIDLEPLVTPPKPAVHNFRPKYVAPAPAPERVRPVRPQRPQVRVAAPSRPAAPRQEPAFRPAPPVTTEAKPHVFY